MKTVILLRHADVDVLSVPAPNSFPLNGKGLARAEILRHVVGNAGVTSIFASEANRTQQTVQPIAAQLGLSVSIPATLNTLVQQVLSTQAGDVVLIAGHTNTVPEIITALGVPLPAISIQGHDDLFVVTVIASGQASLVHLKYGPPTP